MEVPGLGKIPLNIDTNRIVPEVLPNRVPLESPLQKTPTKPQETLPQNYQLTKAPAIIENLQTFAHLLAEIKVPNTPQNNQLAQVLANYNQPINHETMTLVSKALGGLMNKGASSIEAGVILLINNLNITNQSVSAIKQLIDGGGLSQNLLNFSKDLQKLVDTVNRPNFVQEVARQIEQGNIISNSVISVADGNSSNLANQQVAGMLSVSSSKENLERVKMDTTAIKLNNEKVEAINPTMKNPYQEEEENTEVTKKSKKPTEEDYKVNEIRPAIKQEDDDEKNQKSKNVSVIIEDDIQNKLIENKVNPNEVLGKLSMKAQQINKNIINLITLDVLKNPEMFPMQISMLKKFFSELELDVKEFKEILKQNFPQLLNKIEKEQDSEMLYSNLLKLIYQKDNNKNNLKALQNLDLEFITSLIRTAEKLNLNIIGRETLTKSLDAMCLPISVFANGRFHNVEILIQREDQSDKKVDVGEIPLKIQLSLETKTLGKVVVDINNWKKDLRVYFIVENVAIQKKMQENFNDLENNLKELPFDVHKIHCIVSPKQNENASILLPQKYKTYSLKRIEGIA